MKKTETPCTTFVLALAVALLAGAAARGSAAPAFRVVVNASNPTTSMTRDDVARLFLKKETGWPNKQPALPVDQTKSSITRRVFSRSVLGRDVEAVESYWQQAIFSGRALPPLAKATDAEVTAYVRANPNAIGYVSGSADLGTGVKELIVN
jgi:ABC-type phosphate transport system substrate-binding protein